MVRAVEVAFLGSDEWAQVINVFEKPRTDADITRVDGIAGFHVDLGDLVRLEKG